MVEHNYSIVRASWWLRLKNLPAMQETWIRSLGWEDPLEKGMATYSSILAQRIPWTEEPGGLESTGLQRLGNNSATKTSLFKAYNILYYDNEFEQTPGDGEGQGHLVCYGPWGRKESDTTQ